MAKLLYQGHGSLRIRTDGGAVVYIDPYAGEGYDLPADLILVTHGHHDHDKVSLVARKPDSAVITHAQALKNGIYNKFTVKGVSITAVPAQNKNHRIEECVGYILELDGRRLYAAGDTSTTDAMREMASLQLDYALLPIDGIYNMDPKEAAQCARVIKAKHNIPIHMKPGALFDRAQAERFDTPDRLIVKAGEEIDL